MVEVELDDDDTEATVEAKLAATAAAVVVVVESQFWLEVGVVVVSDVGEALAVGDVAPAVELVEVGGAELDGEEPALATTAEYCCISMTAASSNT